MVGIAVLLLVLGLSGCFDDHSEHMVSIFWIINHPNDYINQTVTVKGTYCEWNEVWYAITDPDALPAKNTINVVKPKQMVYGSEYKFTGIVRYGMIIDNEGLYLEVRKIES